MTVPTLLGYYRGGP